MQFPQESCGRQTAAGQHTARQGLQDPQERQSGAQPSVATWLPFNSEDGQLLQQSLVPAELLRPNGVAQPTDWSGRRNGSASHGFPGEDAGRVIRPPQRGAAAQRSPAKAARANASTPNKVRRASLMSPAKGRGAHVKSPARKGTPRPQQGGARRQQMAAPAARLLPGECDPYRYPPYILAIHQTWRSKGATPCQDMLCICLVNLGAGTGPQVRHGLFAVSPRARANYRAWTLGSTAVSYWPRARQAMMPSRHQGYRPGSKAGSEQAELLSASPTPEGSCSHLVLLTIGKSRQPCTKKLGYDPSQLRGPRWMLHLHSHKNTWGI